LRSAFAAIRNRGFRLGFQQCEIATFQAETESSEELGTIVPANLLQGSRPDDRSKACAANAADGGFRQTEQFQQ
jgi:hypothetical protein